jgi:hypothetical protein
MARDDLASESAATAPVGIRISDAVLNQIMHSHWRAGGLDGMVAANAIDVPEMIIAPDATVTVDTVVAPASISVTAALPCVVTAVGSNQVDVMLGGLTLTLTGTGPYAGGLRVHLGATVRAALASGTTANLVDDAEVTELVWSTAAEIADADRPGVYAFLVAFVHHVATFSLNDASPTLPLPSLQTSTVLETFGLTAGRRLQALSPQLSGGEHHLQVVGAFGEP